MYLKLFKRTFFEDWLPQKDIEGEQITFPLKLLSARWRACTGIPHSCVSKNILVIVFYNPMNIPSTIPDKKHKCGGLLIFEFRVSHILCSAQKNHLQPMRI